MLVIAGSQGLLCSVSGQTSHNTWGLMVLPHWLCIEAKCCLWTRNVVPKRLKIKPQYSFLGSLKKRLNPALALRENLLHLAR